MDENPTNWCNSCPRFKLFSVNEQTLSSITVHLFCEAKQLYPRLFGRMKQKNFRSFQFVLNVLRCFHGDLNQKIKSVTVQFSNLFCNQCTILGIHRVQQLKNADLERTVATLNAYTQAFYFPPTYNGGGKS